MQHADRLRLCAPTFTSAFLDGAALATNALVSRTRSQDQCCDACVGAAPTDTTSDAYKYYQDKCVAPYTNLGARFAVCNRYGQDDNRKTVCGAPIEFSTVSITDGPTDLKQETDEETGELKPCAMLQSDWDAIFAIFKDSAKMNSVFTEETFGALSETDQAIMTKPFNGIATIFLLGPVVAAIKDPATISPALSADDIATFNTAKISFSGTGSKCVGAMNKPTLNADLDVSTKKSYVAGATVFAGNTITFGGDSSASVVDSTNAATINATTSGAVNIHQVVNTGDLTATGLTGAFLSSVRNSGKVTLNNVEGNAIFIDNAAAGTVEIKGTSNIAVKFCNQKGTVTIADTVTGTVAVPKGHVKPAVPSGVTLTEVADTGCPAFGSVSSTSATTSAALMTDAEETAKAAGLDEVTTFFKAYWFKADKLYKDLNSQCKAVSTAYLPFKSGGATACDSSNQCSADSTENTACCKKGEGGPQKAEGCNEAPEDWRKANNGHDEEDGKVDAVRWLRAAH